MKANFLLMWALFLLGLSTASAQPTFFYFGNLTITPPNPAPGEEICFTVSGIKSTPCVYEEFFELVSLGGSDLSLDMCFNDTSICIQILWPWDSTICIPGLPAGEYNLKLGGCNHTGLGQSFGFTVSGTAAPQAAFTADPDEGCAPLEVAFTNQSLNADSWLWDFGDGQTSTLENPVHAFSASGSYTVKLTATNTGSGLSDVATFAVVVFPLPQVDLGPDTTITTQQVLTLNPGPGFSSYLWNDGSTTAFLQVVGSLLSPGSYTYSVTVTNGQGCEGVAEITVTVTLPSNTEDQPLFPEFLVYPNPAQGILYLETEAKIELVQWLDMTGRVIFQGEPDSRTHLRVPDTADGVYLLKAFTKEYSYGVLVELRR